MRSKKGNSALAGIASLGMALAVIIITFAIVFIVLSHTKQQIVDTEGLGGGTANTSSVGLNATKTLESAAGDVPDWMPLIVLVAIGGVLIVMVKAFAKS